MACKYCVRTKTDKSSNQQKVKYYAVPVSSGIISTQRLAEIISDRCTLTRTDIIACLDAISTAMQKELLDGQKVCLDGIGIYSLSATSPGFESPDECTPDKVEAKRICFLADKNLKKALDRAEFTRVEGNR